jgi:hypothetical protein
MLTRIKATHCSECLNLQGSRGHAPGFENDMLGILFTQGRMEKSPALHHIVKERCFRKRFKNHELHSVYTKNLL